MKPKDNLAAEADTTVPAPAAEKTARIRVSKTGVQARGFTFAKGAVVSGVPLPHAEYLRDRGEAAILSVG